jgi:hypothetical protein
METKAHDPYDNDQDHSLAMTTLEEPICSVVPDAPEQLAGTYEEAVSDVEDAVPPLDFSEYLGNPDPFAGGFREARLRGMLGDELALEKARRALKELRRQSRARRESGSRKLGPYLNVRFAAPGENRTPMVVIQDGRRQVTTGIEYQPGLALEDHDGAIDELGDYLQFSIEEEKQLKDPLDIPLGAVFKEFLRTEAPPQGCDDYDTKWKTYRNYLNYGTWLAEFGKDKTVNYIDEDFGKKYKAWRLKQPARLNVAVDRRDASIEHEQYLAQKTFRWLLKKLRKARVTLPDLEFEIQHAPKRQKRSLTWTEFVWLLLACMGFQREGDSFKKKIEIRHGVPRQVWDRLDCSQTRWLIRFFLVYLCTGTRFTRNSRLLWGENDDLGWLEPDGTAIWRNGRAAVLHPQKPAGRSSLTPAFAAFVRKWYRQDLRLSAKWGRQPVYVMHDGNGNPIPDIEGLVREVFRRAGLQNSAHILKHTCVTLMALFGYSLDEIARHTNTRAATLKDSYLWLPWLENQREWEAGRGVTLSRLVDLKKKSPLPILPEVAAEAAAKFSERVR